MHTFFLTRGIKKDVDEVVKFLETRALPMNYLDKEGKKKVLYMQANLQPIQLWSYVFPETEKDSVFTGLYKNAWNGEGRIGGQAAIAMLRKALGARKMPEFKTDKSIFLPEQSMRNVAITPIGVKDDALDFKDPNGTIHEAI